MKQTLLLVLFALLGLGAHADGVNYKGGFKVTLSGTENPPVETTVILTEHDGKVDLELKNFVFDRGGGSSVKVGDVKMADLPIVEKDGKKTFDAKGKAVVSNRANFLIPGSMEATAVGDFTSETLNFTLDLNVSMLFVSIPVKIVFAGTQVKPEGLTVVSAASKVRQGIYTIDGRRLSSLPARGIYIVNGRKVVR